MKQIVDLKEGMTAKVEGGKLVIEMPEKYTPKKGDFVTCDRNTQGNKWIMIWSGFDRGLSNEFCGYVVNDKRLDMGGNSCLQTEIFRPSTREERNMLISALADKGKRWDAEKMQIVDIEWKPTDGEFVTQNTNWVSIYAGAGLSGDTMSDYCGTWINVGNFTDTKPSNHRRTIELRKSTPAEIQRFHALLEETGKKWNPDTKKVEDLEWRPKEGDVVTNQKGGTIFIQKSPYGDMTSVYAALYNGEFYTDSNILYRSPRPATREERCTFFARLVAEGYKWNAKKLKLTKVGKKWSPVDGDFVAHTDKYGGTLISIFKGLRPDGTFETHAGVGDGPWRGLLIDYWSLAEWADRPATESEIKIMNDALAKAGKRWNAELKRVEDVKPEYKEGDFLRTNGENVFIYKNTHNGLMFDHAFMFSGGDVTISDGPSCHVDSIPRHATEQEKQKLLDGLAKIGKKWNAAAKRIDQCRWRAEPGDIYEYVDLFDGKIDTVQKAEMSTPLDDSRFNLGNYFKPGSGDIEKAADKINEIFKSNL